MAPLHFSTKSRQSSRFINRPAKEHPVGLNTQINGRQGMHFHLLYGSVTPKSDPNGIIDERGTMQFLHLDNFMRYLRGSFEHPSVSGGRLKE